MCDVTTSGVTSQEGRGSGGGGLWLFELTPISILKNLQKKSWPLICSSISRTNKVQIHYIDLKTKLLRTIFWATPPHFPPSCVWGTVEERTAYIALVTWISINRARNIDFTLQMRAHTPNHITGTYRGGGFTFNPYSPFFILKCMHA